jgi:enediyne biosynthesis protein E4
MSGKTSQRRILFFIFLVVGGVFFGGWKWWEFQHHRQTMAEIENEIVSGLHGSAGRKLTSILARQPNSAEALYLLGTLEMARGRPDAASEAWARVPPGSDCAPQAIEARVQANIALGRLAEAERIFNEARVDPRIDSFSLSLLLGTVLSEHGRLDEALRMIESCWEALNRVGDGNSEHAIKLVRSHVELRRRTVSIQAAGEALERASRLAPNDDRIWLARANLAIRAGSYDEAAHFIDACLGRRPDDPTAWHARLDWAVAANRVAEAREALDHLPANLSTPARIHKLTAWFAARRGDVESERRALERVIAADPADFFALDRLALLAEQNGQPDRAAGIRREKAGIERTLARYDRLHARHQPKRDAAEMAALAEKLGQRFEAMAFLTLAVAVDPDRHDLRSGLDRLKARDVTLERHGRTLADLLASEFDEGTRRTGHRTNL